MNQFDLIIFDCDGVLVDSERIACQVFATILSEECGFNLSLTQMVETFVGHSKSQCMEIVEEMLGSKPPSAVETRYKHEINQVLSESVTAVAGIERALEAIDIPYCVASSGSYPKMRTTLGKSKLLERFKGRIYSTSDVPRGKPYPDIYLHAAQNMGFHDPARCLVIEDSTPGVLGGVAAGMVVFGFAALMSEKKLLDAGAQHIFTDMGKLADEIIIYTGTKFPGPEH